VLATKFCLKPAANLNRYGGTPSGLCQRRLCEAVRAIQAPLKATFGFKLAAGFKQNLSLSLFFLKHVHKQNGCADILVLTMHQRCIFVDSLNFEF